MCGRNIVLYCMLLCSAGAQYLARGERRRAVIPDGRRPLGRDAHFHVAERLPGRM